MPEIELLLLKFDEIQATMKQHINVVLDERGIRGSESHTNNILADITNNKKTDTNNVKFVPEKRLKILC